MNNNERKSRQLTTTTTTTVYALVFDGLKTKRKLKSNRGKNVLPLFTITPNKLDINDITK